MQISRSMIRRILMETTSPTEKCFVRATGDNRYAGGTPGWLLIRNVRQTSPGVYELQVNIRGTDRYVEVHEDVPMQDLRFRISSMPATWQQVKKAMLLPE